jgi:O-antigen ligase
VQKGDQRPSAPALRTGRRALVEWLLFLGLALLPLQAAATVQVVYTLAPSYAAFALALALGMPEVSAGARRLPRHLLAAGVFVFVVYLAMSRFGDFTTLSAQARGGSVRALVYTAYVIFGMLLACLLVGVATRRFLGRAVAAVVAGGVLVALYGIWTWFALHYNLPLADINNAVNSDGYSHGRPVYENPGLFGWNRIRGTFTEPLGFGGFLIVPLLLCGFLAQQFKRRRRVVAIAALPIVVALCLTDSSISVAALGLGGLFAIWQLALASRRVGSILGASIVAIALTSLIFVLLFDPAPLGSITSRGARALEVSLSGRETAWRDAAKIWTGRPVIGFGPGQASVRLAKLPDAPEPPVALHLPKILRSAQGIVMSSLVDVGVVGLAGWTLLFGAALVLAARLALRGRRELAWLAASLLAGLFVTSVNGDRVGLDVWVMVGIVVAASVAFGWTGPIVLPARLD